MQNDIQERLLLFRAAGDVAFRVLDSIHQVEQKSYNQSGEDGGLEEEATRVYVCDINRSMLEVGKERARDRGETFWLAHRDCYCVILLLHLIITCHTACCLTLQDTGTPRHWFGWKEMQKR